MKQSAHAAAVSEAMKTYWRDPEVRARRRLGVRCRRLERHVELARQRGNYEGVAYWETLLDQLKSEA